MRSAGSGFLHLHVRQVEEIDPDDGSPLGRRELQRQVFQVPRTDQVL